MKQTVYTVQSKTADGTAHAVGRIVFEGRKKVHAEMQFLRSQAENQAYTEKLSKKCRITPH